MTYDETLDDALVVMKALLNETKLSLKYRNSDIETIFEYELSTERDYYLITSLSYSEMKGIVALYYLKSGIEKKIFLKS